MGSGLHGSRRVAAHAPHHEERSCSALTLSNSQASSARVLSGDGSACRRIPRGRAIPRKWAPAESSPENVRGSGAPEGASTIPRLRGAARVLRRRQVYAVCANLHETRSPLGAPPRRFWPSDCSDDHPDRPFGLLIPRAFACVCLGAIYQLWRALVVGPGSTPRLPEMACETIRRRRTRSANQDASRWRPRMSRQEHDTELLGEKSLHARDMRG